VSDPAASRRAPGAAPPEVADPPPPILRSWGRVYAVVLLMYGLTLRYR
jgi:hypothetical protein